jgi:hypothetical protein
MPARGSVEDTFFDGLAQDPQPMGSALWPFIQEEHAVRRPRHLARHRCRPTLLFVKNVPRLTIHGHERASLLLREPGDVFYKMAADQACIQDGMMGDTIGPGRHQGRAPTCQAGYASVPRGVGGLGQGFP